MNINFNHTVNFMGVPSGSNKQHHNMGGTLGVNSNSSKIEIESDTPLPSFGVISGKNHDTSGSMSNSLNLNNGNNKFSGDGLANNNALTFSEESKQFSNLFY